MLRKLVVGCLLVLWGSVATATLLDEARQFFAHVNEVLSNRYYAESFAQFTFETNTTTYNHEILVKIGKENKLMIREMLKKVEDSGFMNIEDKVIQRLITRLAKPSDIVLGLKSYEEQQNLVSDMLKGYAETRVCVYTNKSDCTLHLEPELLERFANSRDPQELAWYWQQWYDKAGTPLRESFAKYVHYGKRAAKLNNFRSRAELWLNVYEDPNFEQNVDDAYKAILPLYRQLHAYVRYRLRQQYGDDVVPANGHIPVHLLGNVWGQTWQNIFDIVVPYAEAPIPNITTELLKQNYTIRKMVEIGDLYFQSLGMSPLPQKFWLLSVLTRPTNRRLICHPSATQFYKADAAAIKMCATVNADFYDSINHELGHVEHMLAYSKQPILLQDSPNDGFGEAIGDTISLSATTHKHLKLIGLLNEEPRLSKKTIINMLLKRALGKIAILPFAYSIDKYRFAVFRSELNESTWNTAFWRMRANLTGLAPPVQRSELNFDPAAKIHVCGDTEYLRYFAAHIFQFQFLRTLCHLADDYEPNDPEKPLYNCDFYGSKKAGAALSKFLALGASKHWKEALKEFTGETEMQTDALMDYFTPLYTWLKETNLRLRIPVGWETT